MKVCKPSGPWCPTSVFFLQQPGLQMLSGQSLVFSLSPSVFWPVISEKTKKSSNICPQSNQCTDSVIKPSNSDISEPLFPPSPTIVQCYHGFETYMTMFVTTYLWKCFSPVKCLHVQKSWLCFKWDSKSWLESESDGSGSEIDISCFRLVEYENEREYLVWRFTVETHE